MATPEKPKPKSKLAFTVEVGDPPTSTQFVVVRPSRKDVADAETERARVFTALLRGGALLEKEVNNVARDRNLWDDKREERAAAIQTEIKGHLKLVDGRVKGTTKAAARAAAIQVRILRAELRDMDSDRRALYGLTAEAKSRDAEFNFLLVRCVRTEDNRAVWTSVDDMLGRDRDALYDQAVEHFLKLQYDIDTLEIERGLPENRFLLQHGFCREDLRLIDPATHHLVDVDGRRIDERGRLVDADGNPVDDEGNRLNDDGTPVVERYPFLD